MLETAQMPTEPQRLRALEHANAIRLARAELKRRIAEGEISAATVILECPDAVRRWTVAELLMAQRGWGGTRCRKFLERNGVSELKTTGALTDRQRRLLAEQLSGCVELDAGGAGSRLDAGGAGPRLDVVGAPRLERELAVA